MQNNYCQSGREVQYCSRCLMPSTRPRIVFNSDGVCNACLNSDEKKKINWNERKNEFHSLLDKFRSHDGYWDCIVPWSGGKDSSSIAYRLKYEYGMNPLLITFSPLLPNDIGSYNREALIQKGFDHIFFRPNQKIHRYLARRFFIERGNPKVAWDAGINTIPVRFAIKLGIKLIVYAEHGESEYGGKVLNEESKKTRDFTEVIEHQIGDDPRNWIDDVVSENDLNPYIYPDPQQIRSAGINAIYFSYYHMWDMFENYQYIKDKIDFKTHPVGRTPGTFTNFDSLDDKSDNLYYYMQYIKFGFGRAVRDASRLIQNDHITREKGLKYAKLYDGEFPEEFLYEMQAYFNMTRDELLENINLHRNSEIWKKKDEVYTLINPLR